MKIKINTDGTINLLYTEDICVEDIGKVDSIKRLFHVEPTQDNKWTATVNIGSSECVTLGPFDKRSEALGAEVVWIEDNILF